MPLCVSLELDSDCSTLLGSSEDCGFVLLPVLCCVYLSPLPQVSGLKDLVLSQVTWLHFFSLCGVSGLYGFSPCTRISAFTPCI